MNKEIQTYLRYCLPRPGAQASLFRYAVARFGLRLREKIRPADSRMGHYPKRIRIVAGRARAVESVPDGWAARLPATGWKPGSGPSLVDWQIPLATHSIPLEQADWRRSAEDREDIFALHRFGWLLQWISLQPAAAQLTVADNLIQAWIAEVTPEDNSAAWETYSAAERVVNWLLYLCATAEYRVLDDAFEKSMGQALRGHLAHIGDHLEYYNQECNNHILNDARGLYIGGRLLEVEAAAALGRALFEKHLEALVSSQGVLREGSSHYQLLLTRSLREVAWVAEQTGDLPFSNEVAPVAVKMQRFSSRFQNLPGGQSTTSFPAIGDLSPDFPVRWFSGFGDGRTGGSGRWIDLWGPGAIQEFDPPEKPAAHFIDSSSGWYVLPHSESGWTMIVYAADMERPYPGAHGHLDFGSFVLYDRHGPVLDDRGRFAYTPTALGKHGYSPEAHNTSCINGLPVLPGTRGIFNAYRDLAARKTAFAVLSKQPPAVEWTAGTAERIAPGLQWRRRAVTRDGCFEMKERVNNPGKSPICLESYLHFSPGWRIARQADAVLRAVGEGRVYELNLAVSEAAFRIDILTDRPDSLQGWHFSDYGRQTAAPTVRLTLEGRSSLTIQWTLACA